MIYTQSSNPALTKLRPERDGGIIVALKKAFCLKSKAMSLMIFSRDNSDKAKFCHSGDFFDYFLCGRQKVMARPVIGLRKAISILSLIYITQ